MTKPRLSFILPLFLKASFSLLASNSGMLGFPAVSLGEPGKSLSLPCSA